MCMTARLGYGEPYDNPQCSFTSYPIGTNESNAYCHSKEDCGEIRDIPNHRIKHYTISRADRMRLTKAMPTVNSKKGAVKDTKPIQLFNSHHPRHTLFRHFT